MIRKILVPVDGSEHSRTALDFACELGAKFEAELSVLHVVKDEAAERVVMVLGSSHVSLPADPERIEAAGHAVLEAAKERADSRGRPLASAVSASGPPAKEILAYAENGAFDTIVIGSRGLSDLGGLLLGSVSHKISHLAPCTCIVVRSPPTSPC